MAGLCDYCVTPVPIGCGFGTALGQGSGLRGPDLGLTINSLIDLRNSGWRGSVGSEPPHDTDVG